MWVLFIGSISLRFYFLITGVKAPLVSFAQNLVEMGVICSMLSHLAFDSAAKYIKYILPAVGLAFIAGATRPDWISATQITMQALCYLLLGYQLHKLYLLRRPYYLLLLTMTVIAGANFFFFEMGLFSGPVFHSYSQIIVPVVYMFAILTYSAYLTRMAALTSKKFVESEVVARKLREVDHLKTKFFSSITHEFRTPLTLIQGPADELAQRITEPESLQLLDLIKANSNRLLKLINQLLDLAKLDAQEMKLVKKDIVLEPFLLALFSQFEALAALRRISFEWSLPPQPVNVVIDDEKVEAILSNLISNALKFTQEDGRVKVSVSIKGEMLYMEVNDTGRGISSQKLVHIFDRFYQVEPSDSSHAEGTGIGLALVKEYVELMKGLIHVESYPGIGTRFVIELPVETTPSAAIPTPSHPTPVIAREKYLMREETDLPLLLLADDNDDIRLFVRTCLGKNFEYTEARHGRDALAQSIALVPDIIISDVMMPEMDGIEFCRRAKNDERINHIPIIILTAKASEHDKLEGLQTGADDYLSKPFNKAELAAKVENLISNRRKLQAHLRKSFLTQAVPIQPVSIEEQFISKAKAYIELHLGDNSLNVESLAAEMNLSREQCYRKLIALTNLSPSAFIRKLRLQRAAQLVRANSAPVSQIAYQVGFENLSHFSKAFKEEFGKVPSEFRR